MATHSAVGHACSSQASGPFVSRMLGNTSARFSHGDIRRYIQFGDTIGPW